MGEVEPDVEAPRNGDTGVKNQETAESPVVRDSGKGSSAHDEVIDDRHFDVGATPKNDNESLEPSLMDRRAVWDAKDQRENLEANHFEALERFLAAMNSTLKSECSASFRAGISTNTTPARDESRDHAERAATVPEEQNNFLGFPQNSPIDHVPSPTPIPTRLCHLPEPLTQIAESSTGNPDFWRLPQADALVPPKLPFPPRPPVSFMDILRPKPPTNSSGLMDVERELRALVTSLERDADELQRRRALLEEHTEATNKQLCAEWQSVEQAKELLKIQRMKVEQDKNELLTHRMKMEEETKAKLAKCDKAQDELKMLQSECQLSKRKLNEQKKQSSDEISTVQQQVIDLQRQAVESDSRISSFRTQITKLKEECRQHKEEADSAKARIKLLESANERLRVENSQLRIHFIEQRDKVAASAPTTAFKCLKTTLGAGDQGKTAQSQTSKCVRFADESTTFRRTKDFCVQAAGPSDMATQTSFLEASPSLDNWLAETNPVLERAVGSGKKEIIYPNDTVQIRDVDGAETFSYASGDVLRCLPDGTKIYHSASDGRTEIRNPDGTLTVKNVDGSSEKYKFMPDGTEIVTYSNGTVIEKRPYGVEIAYLYDKSKETRCSHYTLREFPSGDIKKLFADGSTETRLVCGRVRVKDHQGNVIKDLDEYPVRPPA